MGQFSWIIQVTWCNPKSFLMKKREAEERMQSDVTWERLSLLLLALKMEVGWEWRNVGSLKKLEKASEWIPPSSLQKQIQSCQHLHFSSVRLILDFWHPELSYICIVLNHYACGFRYKNNRKITQCQHHLEVSDQRVWLLALKARMLRC